MSLLKRGNTANLYSRQRQQRRISTDHYNELFRKLLWLAKVDNFHSSLNLRTRRIAQTCPLTVIIERGVLSRQAGTDHAHAGRARLQMTLARSGFSLLYLFINIECFNSIAMSFDDAFN